MKVPKPVLPDAPVNCQKIQLNQHLTLDQVAAGFKRTRMTIFNWKSEKGLPYIKIAVSCEQGNVSTVVAQKTQPIYFDLEKILKWAECRGLEFDLTVCEDDEYVVKLTG